MNLRVRIILAMLVVASLVTATSAFGASDAYPGAKLMFQMNLTESDFLPALKQFLPALPDTISEIAKQHDPNAEALAKFPVKDLAQDLIYALEGLKSVSVTGYDIKGADSGKLVQFYTEKMGLTKGWLSVIKADHPQGVARLYVKPGVEEMFGLGVHPKGYVVVHTTGKIDTARLGKLASKLLPAAIMMGRQTPSQGEAASQPSVSDTEPQATPPAN